MAKNDAHIEPIFADLRDVVDAREASRKLWFKRYPAAQTLVSFILAVLATCAFSIDPYGVDPQEVFAIDATATGLLYIAYEVLLSFAGHTDAVMLLALACLLTFPVRYVFFGRGDSWRPSVVIPALLFAICMVFGQSYDLTNTAELVVEGSTPIIKSLIAGSGWYLLAHIGTYLAYECFEWLSTHRLQPFANRHSLLWRFSNFLVEDHAFLVPFIVILLAWLPTFIAAMPGLFMGDTGAQIRQWFNLPNGTSSYLNLLNPDVLLNGHHPVVHTALIGTCVSIGQDVFGDVNTGVLIYTIIQYMITAAVAAYALACLRQFGVGLLTRVLVLAFFVFMPMFSNYAVLITKDVYFADAFALLLIQAAKLVLLPHSVLQQQSSALTQGKGISKAGFAGDTALLLIGALGCSFLRNGGLVFAATVLLLTALVLLVRVVKRKSGDDAPRWLVAVPAAVLVVCVASSLWFTNVFMPQNDITPGSKREALSIPFQMTARYVQKHDGANSGVEGGVSDGLVSAEERAVIDKVLNYENLGKRYDPDKSDAVKNSYNENATSEDIKEYFKVWAEMFVKDPESYVSAFINNYYGYFYPSQQDAWVYSTEFSHEVMARQSNQKYFDFQPATGTVVEVCDQAVNLYRTVIQRTPLLSLTLSSATYVWGAILAVLFLLRKRDWKRLALWVPLVGVIAMCLIGPCNGSTYMRYLYPLIFAGPSIVALTMTRLKPPVPEGESQP